MCAFSLLCFTAFIKYCQNLDLLLVIVILIKHLKQNKL